MSDSGAEFSIGPAGDFLSGLWRVNHALERASRAMESAHGVSSQQRIMMRFIGRYPGMTASQLAAQLHLDAGTVSAALGRLERKGLIERRRASRDRRRVTIGLTADGRALDASVAGTAERSVEALLASTSPEDVSIVRDVLHALAVRLESSDVSGTGRADEARSR